MIKAMAGFSSYRQLCDGLNRAFLRLGLRDEELYEAAIHDPRTVSARDGDQLIPLLCPIEYASGYDGRRIRELTSRDDVFLLSVPPSLLPGVMNGGMPPEFSVLVESDGRDTAEHREKLTKIFPRSAVRDFEDPRAQNSTAAMLAYTATVHPREGVHAEGVADTVILSADRLRGDLRLADEIWALYGGRFDWLGECHPVAMEDSREVFLRALFHDDTRTIVKFEQGRPACVGLFMEGLGQCYWLAPGFRERLESQAAAGKQLYFYGIASRAQGGEGHARDVMAMLERMIWQDGKVCHLTFETTNLSSLYIPRIVARRAQESPYVEPAPGETVRPIEKVDYWYLDVGKPRST
jgi:hypothetical protein